MPAFDPVRDAVLNSPITPAAQPLSTNYQSLPHHNHNIFNPESNYATTSPTLTRRATDLSVLLNAESQEPFQTSPTPRSSTLSRLLLPTDVGDDKLANSESLRKPANQQTNGQGSSYFSGQPSPPPTNFSRKLLSDLVHPSPVPGPSNSRPSPKSRSPAISNASILSTTPSSYHSPTRHTASLPRMPSPPRPRKIAYSPKNRITPAASILVPMSTAEMEMYKNYRGVGTQRLAKRKREKSVEPDGQPPSKKLAGDVGVVVTHCG
jgi:mRNA (guanine-N7-)-methyltransferase